MRGSRFIFRMNAWTKITVRTAGPRPSRSGATRRSAAIRPGSISMTPLTATVFLHMGAGVMWYRNPDEEIGKDFDRHHAGTQGPYPVGFPPDRLNNISPTGSLKFGTGMNILYVTKPTAVQSISWVHGNHTYKFGAEWALEATVKRTLNGGVGIVHVRERGNRLSGQHEPQRRNDRQRLRIVPARSGGQRHDGSLRRRQLPAAGVGILCAGHLEDHAQDHSGLRNPLRLTAGAA